MIDDARRLAYNGASETDRFARSCPVGSCRLLREQAANRPNLRMRAVSTSRVIAPRPKLARKEVQPMPERTATSVVAKPVEAAKAALPVKPVKVDFETFLAALSARDRLNIERHI